MTYPDLCTPYWIDNEPELFYGFWGQCFNDYRRTTPHSGYFILKLFKEFYFGNNFIGTELFTELLNNPLTLSAFELLHPNSLHLLENFNKNINNENNNNNNNNENDNKGDDIEKNQKEKEENNKTISEEVSTKEGNFQTIISLHKNFREEFTKNYLLNSSFNSTEIGPFYIYTSNVDSHSEKAGFKEYEVEEIHGSIEVWCCQDGCSSSSTAFPSPIDDLYWPVPSNFRFVVDQSTMLANDFQSNLPYLIDDYQDSEEILEKFIIELKEGGAYKRDRIKRGIYSSKVNEKDIREYAKKIYQSFTSNQPKCIHNFEHFARPCILMFGDIQYQHDRERTEYHHHWVDTVQNFSPRSNYQQYSYVMRNYRDDDVENDENDEKEVVEGDKGRRLIILEIGAGNNVPTIRWSSEGKLMAFTNSNLIRINLDFPQISSEKGGISIQLTGKIALHLIFAEFLFLLSSHL